LRGPKLLAVGAERYVIFDRDEHALAAATSNAGEFRATFAAHDGLVRVYFSAMTPAGAAEKEFSAAMEAALRSVALNLDVSEWNDPGLR
jgi:hypothetical protein